MICPDALDGSAASTSAALCCRAARVAASWARSESGRGSAGATAASFRPHCAQNRAPGWCGERYGGYGPPGPQPPRNRHDGQRAILATLGAVLLAGGGLAWLATSAVAVECRSGLVTALDPQQCTLYTDGHTLGAVGAVVGIVLIIIAVVRS